MITLRVWGDYALFTRPEFKVERVSYDVPTASACRGVLSAIYWKPQMHWQIRRIAVMNPIRWINMMRNEVSAVMPRSNVDSAMRSNATLSPIVVDKVKPSIRQQRHSCMLKDVSYIIEASILPSKSSIRAAGSSEWTDPKAEEKHNRIARRRIETGQCVRQPFLGTRECSCWFEPAEFPETGIPVSKRLGVMLYDIDWPQDYGVKDAQCVPFFCNLNLNEGIIDLRGRDPVVASLLRDTTECANAG